MLETYLLRMPKIIYISNYPIYKTKSDFENMDLSGVRISIRKGDAIKLMARDTNDGENGRSIFQKGNREFWMPNNNALYVSLNVEEHARE